MRTLTPRCWLAASCVLLAAGPWAGCETAPTGPQTTRLRIGDMQQVVDATVEKLAGSDWLATRSPDSPDRIVIGVERIENRSSDVITRSEQWYLMQSVSSRVVSSGLGRASNLAMVIPAQRLAQASSRGTIQGVAASDRNVTHSMTAAIESITRTGGGATGGAEGRQDFYSCVYRVVNLQSGELVWEDRVEFSHTALGRSFN
ncbi:MAG: hypothetical protein ACI89L_001335 [Phycisphaerales bacterium]|jgi:hypothetical protein